MAPYLERNAGKPRHRADEEISGLERLSRVQVDNVTAASEVYTLLHTSRVAP